MKYRDNMTAEEQTQLLRECEAQDRAYGEAAKLDAAKSAQFPEDADYEDEYSALCRAALNHRGQP